MKHGREVILGVEEKQFDFDRYRFCWDAISRDDNFFITKHPATEKLYLATIGSFHSFKFLPIIGKYVVKMLNGDLDDEHKRRWAWDREMDGGSEGHVYWPKRDWADVVR
jgi:sarcosine oxidase / L-pipecolate oxidase